MRIGWDLDGVVYDFTESIRDFICRTSDASRTDLPNPAGWNTWESWGMSKDRFMEYFRDGIADGRIWRYGMPIVGAVDTMQRQRDQGHSIHIVTHRNDFGAVGVSSTAHWLEDWKVPYDTLTFAKDKTVVPVDIFIEDNVDNALALQAAGVIPVLMTQSWNVNDEKAKHLLRVYNFEHFQYIVERVQRLRTAESHSQEVSPDRQVARPTPTTERGKLLAEADQIIHGDRNRSYGSPTQNFTDTAEVWTVQLRHLLKKGAVLAPADVARLMVALKLTRMVAGDKKDNWLDIAGYAACGWETFADSQN